MGAHNFEHWARGTTAEDAYNNAVADAQFEEGHNPYNGTISTTNSFVMIPFEPGEEIHQWSARVTDDDRISKWGNCGCVEDPDAEPNADGEKRFIFAGWAAC